MLGARFAVMADLHGLVFGEDNKDLINAVEQNAPDAVLVAGDMIFRENPETLEQVGKLLASLAQKYPVIYALGNHEYKIVSCGKYKEQYEEYEKKLIQAGVLFLHNEKLELDIAGTDFIFYGLELPMEYYHKPTSPKLSLNDMEHLVGTPSREGVHVLLAHNPKYGKTYFSWGADLIISGHYHGGVVRFSEHRGLTSPQFLLFPPYCCGDFRRGGQHMIVSAGLGEHTVPVRIHNPRELVVITMKPLEKNEHSS